MKINSQRHYRVGQQVVNKLLDKHQIRAWMTKNVSRFVDSQTNEIDYTKMVETWDIECSDGKSTLDTNHVAWEIATDITI